jgi:hypothetical protein
MDYSYKNIQDSFKGGKKMTRRVIIKKNGKGHKSVCTYKNGKKCYNKRKQLSNSEMNLISSGIFIPGLFNDLFSTKKISKSQTKKNRK